MTADSRSEITIDALERGDIDAAAFDHEAHVFAAWQFISAMPLPEAIQRFSAALKRLTRDLGVPEKYHGTVTWFYLLLIAERRQSGEEWCAFRAANRDLFERDLLSRYYTPERLASEEARAGFVLPDRLAARQPVDKVFAGSLT